MKAPHSLLLLLLVWGHPALAAINAVGYVNTAVGPGLSLLTNPLLNRDSRIVSLFGQVGDRLPNGSTVYLFNSPGFLSTRFDATNQRWLPEDIAEMPLLPGEGFFFLNPSSSGFVVTFVGEVAQGTLFNHIPAGLSIRSSIVPQAGTLDELGFPAEPGDIVFLLNQANQKYSAYFFDQFDLRWVPTVPRVLTGEAFYVWKEHPADWVRDFSVIFGPVGPLGLSDVVALESQ